MGWQDNGDSAIWVADAPAESSVTVEPAPPEFNNTAPVEAPPPSAPSDVNGNGGPPPDQGGGGGGGGGGVDQATLNQLYQQYLGRGVDTSGANTWTGQDINSVIAGITGSAEYANNQGGGGGGGGQNISPSQNATAIQTGPGQGGPTDLNALYQQYLGRNVDPSGAQTFAGMSTQDVTNAILSSPEYASRSGTPSAAPSTGSTDLNALYQQYLGRNADPTGVATWAGQTPEAIIAGITGSQEYMASHPGGAPVTGLPPGANPNATPGDPSTWIARAVSYDTEGNPINEYVDPKTGNVYSSQDANAVLLASGKATSDKYLAGIDGLSATDKQTIYDLKTTDPTKYYEGVAAALNKQIFSDYTTNANYSTNYNTLQTLRDVAPEAYYKAQLDLLGKQVGWQIGQNTSDRNAPIIEEIKKIAPAAYQAGISVDDINSIVNTAASQANIQNQQRIANDLANGGSGFNFGKDIAPGLALVAVATAGAMTGGAALAIGESVLGAGAVGAATLGGAVMGAGFGALSAAAMGGNIEKGAIYGAIGGGVGGAGSELASSSSVWGTANGLVGTETIQSIASATGLSADQVANIIVRTAASTIAASATGAVNSGNFAKVLGTSLASSAIGAYAGNVVSAIDPTASQAAINAVSSIASIGTTTVLNGGNLTNALLNNIPNILGNAAATYNSEQNQSTGTTPFGTENIGFTSGGVDNVLQSGLVDQYVNASADPIYTFGAQPQNNWFGDATPNMQFITNTMIDQNMPKDEIVSNLSSLYNVDQKTAEGYYNNTVAANQPTEATQDYKNKPFVSTADNFNDAFKEARAAGTKTFEWNGKPYTTDLAPKATPAPVSEWDNVNTKIPIVPSSKDSFMSNANNYINKIFAPSESVNAPNNLNYTSPAGDIGFSDAAGIDQNNKYVQAVNNAQQFVGNQINTGIEAAKPTVSSTAGMLLGGVGSSVNSAGELYSQFFDNSQNNAAKVFGLDLKSDAYNLLSDSAKKEINAFDAARTKGEGFTDSVSSFINAAKEHPIGLANTVLASIGSVLPAIPLVITAPEWAGAGLAGTVAGTTVLALATGVATWGPAYQETKQQALDAGMSPEKAQEVAISSANYQSFYEIIGTFFGGEAKILTGGGGIFRNLGKEFVVSSATGASQQAEQDYQVTGKVDLTKMCQNGILEGFAGTIASGTYALMSRSAADTGAEKTIQQTNNPLMLKGPESQVNINAEVVPNTPLLTGPESNTAAGYQISLIKNVQDQISAQLQFQGMSESEANAASFKQIGSDLVDKLNNSALTLAEPLQADKVYGTDASGKPITVAEVFASLSTNEPILDTRNGSESERAHNTELLNNIKSDLSRNNIPLDKYALQEVNPEVKLQKMASPEKQAEYVATQYEERPDIRNLFKNDNIFGSTDLTVPETQTATKTRGELVYGTPTQTATQTQTETQPQTATKTRGELIYGTPTQTATQTMPQTATQTMPQTATQTMPQTATQTMPQTATQTMPQTATQTSTATQTQTETPTQHFPVQETQHFPVTENIPTSYVPINPPSSVNPPSVNVPPIDVPLTTPTNNAPKTPALKVPVPLTTTTTTKKKKHLNPPDLQEDRTKGRKIALPLQNQMNIINSTQPSNVIPMKPTNLNDQLKAAAAGGLMRLATGGAATGATSGSNISIGPGDAAYSPVANFVKGTNQNPDLPGNYNLQEYTYTPPVYNPNTVLQQILGAAQGGAVHMAAGGDSNPAYDPGATEVKMKGKPFSFHKPFVGLNINANAPSFNTGGEVEGHNPQFFSEGGLNAMENRYVQGAGDGTSDSIPAMLANGEFVIPADVVSSLGNGSNNSGASVLDEFLKTIRAHKNHENKNGLPPDSKGALGYLLEAKRKVRA